MSVPSPSPTIEGVIPAPPGQTSRPEAFDAADTLYKWNVLCQVFCLGFTAVMLLLRVYVRAWVKRVWILEDWLCCAAFAALAVYSSLLTTVIYHHGGTHAWNLTQEQAHRVTYWVNINQITYGPAAASIKTTILLLYLRIFAPRRGSGFSIGIRLFMVTICLFYTALSTAKIAQCIPRQKIWESSLPGKCIELPVLLDTSGAFNIISDTAILLIPIKGLWSLQMAFKKKLGIYAIFTVGIIGPAVSIIGLVERLRQASSKDQSYGQIIILLWADAELATGMMIICLPILGGLRHHRSRRPSTSVVNGSQSKSRSGSKYYPGHGSDGTDEDNRLVRGRYLELEERRMAEQKHFVSGIHSEAVGGHDSEDHGRLQAVSTDDLGARIQPQRGQILKTVTVEQSS